MNFGLTGESVERVALDFGITLITNRGSEIRIDTPFTLSPADGTTMTVDPARPSESVAVVPLVLHKVIAHAIAADDTGVLALELAHGDRLEVMPDPRYEAWSFARQDGLHAVASPGGGLSTWGADQ